MSIETNDCAAAMASAATVERGERTKQHRTYGWLALAIALALTTICFGVVAATRPHDERHELVMTRTNLEPGWWTRVTVEHLKAGQPSGTPRTVVSIPSDVLFSEGSPDLDVAASNTLATLADALKRTTGPVTVDGYTDLVGTQDSNMRLGLARARAVAQRLIELGVRADRIASRSFGESRPVCNQINADGSDNPDCRARCRRVIVTYTAIV